jgi:hypothetical protein
VLVQPTNAEIAQKSGPRVRPEETFYDFVIVGGGPAGLNAMIETHLDFPAGPSGADLTRRARICRAGGPTPWRWDP